ncbi:thiol reductant ABC exporter subunit CydD [Streptococcus saliviloxodontae]|uniref:ATP-binding cassette subfamily C protein CydD n=1 Tax=Streptococcus saliviloxodontae TaxID=1349416 RepID=A0ABS2PJX7_9STRE|nr:thiol reductant ABC exporter subunit CydD [Streptococcus saliviloxodontae]MBM7635651.1 ATP-binding cassette subfamily C protein CydD [Streptococcus saliviloxodontae]
MLDKAILRLSGIKYILGLLAGLDFLQAIFIIGQAIFLSQSITQLWEGKELSGATISILGFILSYLGRHAMTWIKDHRLDAFSAEQAKVTRELLLQKVFRMGPHLVQEKGSGNIITLALDGIGLIENYLHLILSKMINMSISPWLILLVIAYLDWESGLILFLVFPLIIIFMIVLGYAAQAKADKQYASYQRLSNHFLDSLRGIDTLRFLGLSKRYAKSIYRTSEAFRKATMSALRIGMLSTFALDFFTTLSIAIVAVMLGLRLINGQMTLFPALAVLILSPEYFLPIRQFSSDYHATLDGKNAFQAVQDILNQEEFSDDSLQLEEWSEESQLDLDQISMAYGDKKILEDTNLHIKGYQKIGIVGMSGSGKSTLVNLLGGFLPLESGSIKVNHQEVNHLRHTDWQKQLLYIPQSPYIFELSLRDNIAFYTPGVSDEAILKAIEMVGLEELLSELPDGLDTKIGNGARPLSGGQAQRIALARILVNAKRKVLLFDEPTAHLDIETELDIKERMLPLLEDHLVIFATHRLHWLKEMNLILVLEKGQVVEYGTYEQLMQNKSSFFRLKTAMGGRHD